MNEKYSLMDEDKIKLVDEILRLRDENRKLIKTIEDLKRLIERKSSKEPDVKKSEQAQSSKKRSLPPHRWGRKPGHPGCTRPVPDHIDQEVIQSLSECPDCHHPLNNPTDSVEHIQEDIIPARVEVTRFTRHRYWCSCCQKMITAPYAENEVPYGHLGPQALATMVWFKHHCALPGNKIKDILHDLCGLKISEGAIPQALQRLSSHLNMEAVHILSVLKGAPYKHVDETGWNINGVSHWLWSVVNDAWAFVHIDESRGSRVPKALLGHPFTGILISDFFSAYNRMSGRKQKCLVHLRRDIRNASADDPPQDFLSPKKKLVRLLADAERLACRRGTFSALGFVRRMRRIKDRLFDFATDTYSHKFWQRISKRLLKHQNELFTFLETAGIPPDNNAAERSIKPHVILRNRSFQNRTPNGAQAHSVLSSIVQTLLLQKRQVVNAIALAYPPHRQGVAPVSILFTSNH